MALSPQLLKGWQCLYWHAPVSCHLSHWWLLHTTCNTWVSETQGKPDACSQWELPWGARNRTEIRASRIQTHRYPTFYHGNARKPNQVRLSLMWKSKPWNYIVWFLKKLHLWGCLKGRHIPEMCHRQMKIPDAIILPPSTVMVPKPWLTVRVMEKSRLKIVMTKIRPPLSLIFLSNK